MPAGAAYRAFENRKIVAPARHHVAGPGQKYGDVEALGEALRRLDGDLVAAIDQGDAAAFQRYQCDRRHLFLRRCDQRRRLRAGRGRVARPAAGFADVDEGEWHLREIFRHFQEQRGFLRAGHRDRRAIGEGFLETLEIEPAQLVGLRDAALAAATDRLRIERHGLLATADQKMGARRMH